MVERLSPRWLAFLAVILVGCSSPTEPDFVVRGIWQYTAVDPLGCTWDLVLDLEQTGNAFSGTYVGPLDCNDELGPTVFRGFVTGGRIDGSRVSFTLEFLANTGSLRSGRMSGEVRFEEGEGDDVFDEIDELELPPGTWSATR